MEAVAKRAKHDRRRYDEGGTVDFNPVDVQKNLKGADYPASGEEVASTAESNGAPGDLIEQLRSLGDVNLAGPDQGMAALKRS